VRLVAVVIFTLEYVLHIATAPVSSQFGFSRVKFLTSFWGIVDLATIVPFYFELVLAANGVHWDATPFRVIRMLRILQVGAHRQPPRTRTRTRVRGGAELHSASDVGIRTRARRQRLVATSGRACVG